MADPLVTRPGDAATIAGPVGGPLTFVARGEQTDGRLTALVNVVPPGQGPPLHTHADEDESWFVIEGELRFRLGERVESAPAGTFVWVPRGTPHNFVNDGAGPARILVMFSPSGMERFFDRFAALKPDEIGPQAFSEIGADVAMDVVGPPLAQTHPA